MSLIVAYGVNGTVSFSVFASTPARIVLACDMKRPDMQHHHARNHERQQVMQREEAVQGRIADRIAAHTAASRCSRRNTEPRENRLVMTVAPQKLIWPHGST